MRILPADFKPDKGKSINGKCPNCGAYSLVIRKNKETYFIGCAGWPDCKYTEPMIIEKKDQIFFNFYETNTETENR